MRYEKINPSLFAQNRKRFAELLSADSIAVFHSNDEMPMNGDANYPFRQQSDIFHLSGIDQQDTILVLFPDCPREEYREALFIQETNEHLTTWIGERLSKKDATEISGINNVYFNDSFENIFGMLMHMAEACYLNLNENDRMSNEVPYRDLRFARQCKEKFPLHTYRRCGPLMADIRTVKLDEEVKLIQRACDITDMAFRSVLEFVEPGVMEYEVEAEIIHTFIKNGSAGHAYEPIIASGKDACILHYTKNDKRCEDGDLLLMDFGAEYGHYNADLSRTIPVNGKFTDRQKDVYNAVLRVFKEARQMLRPGTLLAEYHEEVGKIMESELIGLGLLSKKDVENQNPKAPLYKKYFMHGTSHFLGLDVHDIGNRYKPMKAGNVFTCEPGIYIKEENIGIRIENDILLTEGDPKDLMAQIPIEVEEIEQLMNDL